MSEKEGREVTKHLIEQWIGMCELEIKDYKEKNYVWWISFFCAVAKRNCSVCLWNIFEKKHCDDEDGLEDEYEDRINRVRRWKRKLNKMLKMTGQVASSA